jgi:hypothetical protein
VTSAAFSGTTPAPAADNDSPGAFVGAARGQIITDARTSEIQFLGAFYGLENARSSFPNPFLY